MELQNAVCYIRTATYDPTEESFYKIKLDLQKYCRENNINVVRFFYDNGVSGQTFDRKGWQDLKSYIGQNKNVKSIVAPNFNTIGRHLPSFLTEMKGLKDSFNIEFKVARSHKDMVTRTINVLNDLLEPKRKHALRNKGPKL